MSQRDPYPVLLDRRLYNKISVGAWLRLSEAETKPRLVVVHNEVLDRGEIGEDHLSHELLKVDLALPAEHALSLGAVSVEQLDFGGTGKVSGGLSKRDLEKLCSPEVLGVDADDDLAGFVALADLVDALALPSDPHADDGERLFDKLAHRVGLVATRDVSRAQTGRRSDSLTWPEQSPLGPLAGACATCPRRSPGRVPSLAWRQCCPCTGSLVGCS
jgi:hypothetical protein